MATREGRTAICNEWAAAAGGRIDEAGKLRLPSNLRKCLALAELKACARALQLDVREDHDDPEHLTCGAPTEPDEISL